MRHKHTITIDDNTPDCDDNNHNITVYSTVTKPVRSEVIIWTHNEMRHKETSTIDDFFVLNRNVMSKMSGVE